MRLKLVLTWSPEEKKVRICRLLWSRGVVGDGKGYSCGLSLNLVPHLFMVRREWNSWRITFLGVGLHFQKAYGGHIV